MRPLRDRTDLAPLPNGLLARFPHGETLRIVALEDDLFRISARRETGWRLARTWCVAPGAPGPLEGRPRDAESGFKGAQITVDAAAGTIETPRLRVTLKRPAALVWERRTENGWAPLIADRPLHAYMLGRDDGAWTHAQLHAPGDRIWGLGEKAGPLERTGRRFEFRCLDAMGYDAETTDPLYKHMPFLLIRSASGGWASLYYDCCAPGVIDCGQEIDNYHPRGRLARFEDGDLDYYLSAADTPEPLTRRQSWLTGGVAFPPRWSLGYSGSTMQYTDRDDAEARLMGFAENCAAHGLPCESFHLSSGYTAIGAKRYVFNWNRDRFPDPDGFFARFRDAGIRVLANIKPCLLIDHPRYAEAAPLFIRDGDGAGPELSAFWGAEGSHLDFTNPATQDWWAENVTTQLLARGVAATWNDNNEFEVWDRAAICDGFGKPVPIAAMRPVQTLLMLRASHRAQSEHAPDKRPFLVTRSGPMGIQALAQTWTGDNRTEWKTLRWNQKMGLGLALSGVSNIGHDAGGFAGPRPGPELLARWVQNAALHPRFTIHSWNEDGSVTEPWTHPEVLPVIREAMRLRARLAPYLYTLLWRAHVAHAPIIRPTFLAFPDDPRCLEDADEYLLGSDLLVATALDAGATARRLYLPDHPGGWVEFDSGRVHEGGQHITIDAPLTRIPLFLRGGAIVPMRAGDALALRIAPGLAREGAGAVYDDDGETAQWRDAHLVLDAAWRATEGALEVTLDAQGGWRPEWRDIAIDVPADDARAIRINGAERRAINLDAIRR